jgi:hypothetical protein
MMRFLFLLGTLVLATGSGMAAEHAEPSDTPVDDAQEDSPWVSGPDAAPDEKRIPPSRAPRNTGAPPWSIVTPPEAPEAPLVNLDNAPPTLLPLGAQGVHRIALELPPTAAAGHVDRALLGQVDLFPIQWHSGATSLSGGGLFPAHHAVLVDGVPIHFSGGNPNFPLASLLPLVDSDGLHLHGAPLPLAPGGAAAGGATLLDTVGPARDRGRSLQVGGKLRGSAGGPAVEKRIAGAAETGFLRSEVALTASLHDREDWRLAAGEGFLPQSGSGGGHVGGRLSMVPRPGLRIMSSVLSSRQWNAPYATQGCRVDDDGNRLDCIDAKERLLDLFVLGLNSETAVLGDWLLRGQIRSHLHRVGETIRRQGAQYGPVDQAIAHSRAGGVLAQAHLFAPGHLLGGHFVPPSLELAADLRSEATDSEFLRRRPQLVFGEPPGDGTPIPERAPLVDGAATLAGGVAATLASGFFDHGFSLGLRMDRTTVEIPEASLSPPATDTDTDAGAPVFQTRRGMAFSAQAQGDHPIVGRTWRAGWMLFQAERPLSLFHHSGGLAYFDLPEEVGLFTPRQDVVALPAEGVGNERVRGAQISSRLRLPVVAVQARLFANVSDPVVTQAEIDASLPPLPPRQVLGLVLHTELASEHRAVIFENDLVMTRMDRGGFFAETSNPLSGAQPGRFISTFRYAPSAWPAQGFARLRVAMPHARLGPEELEDPGLCPESQVAENEAPCSGAPGFALVDVGGTLRLGRGFALDLLVLNLFDTPARLFGQPLAEGGLSGMAQLTLSL